MNRQLFLLSTLLLLSLQPCSALTESSIDFLRESGFSRVRLTRTKYHLVAKVKINGRPATMVLATNNPISQIDRKLLRKFQLNEEPSGVPVTGGFGGSQKYGLAMVRTLEISKAVVHDTPVAVVDLNIRPRVPRYDGIFALADCRRIGAVIDCDDQALYFNPNGPDRRVSEELRARLASGGFTRAPLHVISQDRLEVGCVINGHSSHMLVALESFATLLTAETAAKADVQSTDIKGTATALGGRMAALNHASVRQLLIGEFEIRNANATVARLETNNLGVDLLESSHAIIDVGGLALYLRH